MATDTTGVTEQQPPPSAAALALAELVPATFRGMPPTAQAFFAVVNPNGTLARGFGAVSSQRLARIRRLAVRAA